MKDIEEHLVGEFDFHRALLFHINRISHLITCYPIVAGDYQTQPVMAEETRRFIQRSFADSVELLESMLYPYNDDEYRKEINERTKLWKEREYNCMETGLDKYAILLKLMDRINLLLNRDIVSDTKGDD